MVPCPCCGVNDSRVPAPRVPELSARANKYAAEAQRMTEAADKDTWRANAAEIARDEAITRAEKAEAEVVNWRVNAEVLLKGTPRDRLVQVREGGGPEDMIASLVVTWAKTDRLLKDAEAELARLRAAGTFNEGIEAASAHMLSMVGNDHGLRSLRRPETGGA